MLVSLVERTNTGVSWFSFSTDSLAISTPEVTDPFYQWEWIHFPVGVEWIRFLIFIFPGKIDPLPLHSRSAPMNKAWGNAALPRMAVDPCGKLPQGLGFRV